MKNVTMTLKRVFEKGRLCFELPANQELLNELKTVLEYCRDKKNDYMSVTLGSPKKPRSTGAGSQNHHLNGHIMQICNETGNDYEAVKYAVKMIAVEQLNYPFETVAGRIFPKRESETDTEECSKLIEASHFLAGTLGIKLNENGAGK